MVTSRWTLALLDKEDDSSSEYHDTTLAYKERSTSTDNQILY